ncbi:MAG: type II 3-dehydroquinate dehydratase [Gammaproteobacteria bacterium]|nr:MAG: type II 3-dehydroquinate dehydratase [Gammaproteobacteria bacterium]PCH64550.1 MAG: type II 3-dehydroquinate dehydratase [Gammaproteobacteria bacterium]
MAKILVLNGPNLNLLGDREPDIYGRVTLNDIIDKLSVSAAKLDHQIVAFQNNAEHELVDRVQQAKAEEVEFLIINPAAFTHTSVALADAISAVALPFIEVHLSNIFARESFRHHSYFSAKALGTITGLGAHGYQLALNAADNYLKAVAGPTIRQA